MSEVSKVAGAETRPVAAAALSFDMPATEHTKESSWPGDDVHVKHGWRPGPS